MFTGIVTHIGKVTSVVPAREGATITIRTAGMSVHRGASVAVNGVCLTAARRRGNLHEFVVIPETMQRTTLHSLAVGDVVNLERPLKYGQPLDGHFVQGHVDRASKVKSLATEKGGVVATIALPKADRHLMVRKGSVALNGVSLTVAQVNASSFSVALVPHTLKHTTFGSLAKGDHVNVEYDVFAKYRDAKKRFTK